MKVLVTGGAGFIGSNFIIYLLKRHPNWKIFNIDKLTYAGNRANLKPVSKNKNYRFVKADICNRKVVGSTMRGCDCVVHFAAETHVDRSIKDATHFIQTNVFGTYVLLEAALKNKIKRFIHISTDEVYGSRRYGFFKESDPFHPSSPYAASKAAADMIAQSYFVTHKLPVIVTRGSNTFGPRQYPEKIIPLFITNLMKGKKVPLYAQGANIRDWLFVDDNCRAIEFVMRKGKIGETYNVSAGNYMTNFALTKAILKKMKKPLSMIKNVKDRPGHDFRYAIDCSKIKKLGFKPRICFDKALSITVDWYRNR